MRSLGEPAAVLQLLDRHNRDCAAFAERLGVPLHLCPVRAGRPVRDGARRPAQALAGGRALVAAAARARHGGRARNRPALLRPGRRAARRPPAPEAEAAAAARAARPAARALPATARACTSGDGAARRPRQLAAAAAAPGDRAARVAPPPLTTIASVLSLFPETAAVEGGELSVGGLRASELAAEFGTPLVVYCEQTILAAARAYREAAPDALPLYSLKAFPNVALLRLLAAEGFGADVSTLGELAFARRARASRASGLVVHGNNKSDEELRAAAEVGARFVVLDALDEVGARRGGRRAARARARHARDRRGHAREDPHRPPRLEVRAPARRRARRRSAAAREAGARGAGVHLHIGSQLRRPASAALETIDWLTDFAPLPRELGWTPRWSTSAAASVSAYVEGERPPAIGSSSRRCSQRLADGWAGTSSEPRGDPRAGPLARRARRPHALPRRRRQAGERRGRPTSRSTAACPTTRARSSTAPATARCSPTAPTRSAGRRATTSAASTASRATC